MNCKVSTAISTAEANHERTFYVPQNLISSSYHKHVATRKAHKVLTFIFCYYQFLARRPEGACRRPGVWLY